MPVSNQSSTAICLYRPSVPALPRTDQPLNLYQQFYGLAVLVGADQLNRQVAQTLSEIADDVELTKDELHNLGQRAAIQWLTDKVQRLVGSMPETVSGGPGCDLNARLEFAQYIEAEIKLAEDQSYFRW